MPARHNNYNYSKIVSITLDQILFYSNKDYTESGCWQKRIKFDKWFLLKSLIAETNIKPRMW